jgi:hypothetical protein
MRTHDRGRHQVSTFCGIEQTAPRVKPWRSTVPQAYDGFEPDNAKSQIKWKRERENPTDKR